MRAVGDARAALPQPRQRGLAARAIARHQHQARALAASRSAATRPIPEVAPVITTTLPCMPRLFTVSVRPAQAVR